MNNLYHCYECDAEMIPTRTPEPHCSACRSDFIEELPSEGTAGREEINQFGSRRPTGTAEEQEEDQNQQQQIELEFNLGEEGLPINLPGVMGGQVVGNDGNTRIFRSPGITFVTQRIDGNNNAGGNGPANPLAGLMQIFGLPLAMTPGRNAEVEAGDPDDLPLEGDRQGQAPIRNLASFLGAAFGPPPPLPANDHPDHPDQAHHNPYAEDTPLRPANNPEIERAERARLDHVREHERIMNSAREQQAAHWNANHPGVPNPHQLPQNAIRLGGGSQTFVFDGTGNQTGTGGNGTPLSFLTTLLNSIGGGIGGQLLGGGRANLGDYAFGNEGFQQILQNLMDQAAAGRPGPRPAPEDMISALPRSSITETMLTSDARCPICTEDYVSMDEILTLPCNHFFHTECIETWLKTSGTCAVCRYALVPQTGDTGGANDPVPTPPVAQPTPIIPNPINLNPFSPLLRPHLPNPPLSQTNATPNPLPRTNSTSSTTTTVTTRSDPNDPNSTTTTTTTTTTSSSTSNNTPDTAPSRTTTSHTTAPVVSEERVEGLGEGEVYMEEID